MTSTTHYDTLEVTESASAEAIKGAYRYLSQKWHPDKHPSQRSHAERVMQGLNAAYAVLSDPAKRSEYDAWLANERAFAEASNSDAGAKTAPDPDSQRNEYIKALSNYSAEPFGAMFMFGAIIVAIVVASLSSEIRASLFGGSLRFGLILLLITGAIEYMLSARKKRRLAQEDISVLHQMYEHHSRRKSVNLALTWVWLLLAISVYVSYLHTVKNSPDRRSLLSLPAAQKFAPLLVRNDCTRPVSFAVHYQRPDTRWQTDGMFAFEPGESSRLFRDRNTGELVQSSSGLFYYYAVSLDKQYVWDGDEANPEHKAVTLGSQNVRFRSAQLKRNEQGDYVLALTCGGGRN